MHRAKTDLERNDKDILVSDRLDGVCQRAAGRRGKGVCSLCKVDTDRVEDSMQTREFSLESLANRVVKLEVQNRRLKKVGVISFIVATVVIAMGQAPAKKVIEANEFVLKDASGTARARLSMEMTNRPTLSFYGDQSHVNASFAGGDEPFLTMERAGTTEQLQLGTTKAVLGLALYDKEIRAGLSVQKGVPALDLFNENGKPQVTLNLSAFEPMFIMTDRSNKTVLWSAP
jgi:hypothetical protein